MRKSQRKQWKHIPCRNLFITESLTINTILIVTLYKFKLLIKNKTFNSCTYSEY